MYKKSPDSFTFGTAQSVIRTTDGAAIPFDPANVDYVAYLAWLAEGNEPLPPDDQTTE
jgi:hypothetical protein